jgi:TPR repeat protein
VLARATSLLKDRDISGARLLFERALQAGSSRAAFQLAETYDPRQLSRWRVHGVGGDWAKAQELYLRAHDGGIMEAKDRIAPIR